MMQNDLQETIQFGQLSHRKRVTVFPPQKFLCVAP